MRKLSDTLARLAALRAASQRTEPPGIARRLAALEDFGANPGNLQARLHVPRNLPDGAPLVVVLHGCTQSADAYDHGAGWSELAEEQGFALLFPQQVRANNPNLCFNWFAPADARRGQGEAGSIRAMIAKMVRDHAIDERRIYITGLSAGGAMSSVMLAAYPELFAGGAIIAGLPFGVADTIPAAFDRMRGHGGPSGTELSDLVRGASSHEGPWPKVSVWHGTADQTVSLANAGAIVDQWRGLQGLPAAPSVETTVDGHRLRVWRDAAGEDRIELYVIEAMGHGTPVRAGGADGLGHAGPYMLDQGISSTRHIARSWGILAAEPKTKVVRPAGRPIRTADAAEVRPLEPIEFVLSRDMPPPGGAGEKPEARPRPAPPAGTDPIRSVIESALRQAGLMK